MSAKYTFLAWDTPVKDSSTKLALLQLANNADDNGFSYYSISKMALACDMSDRTFMRKIQILEKLNVLTVERRSNRPSLYTLIGDEMGVTICHLQPPQVTGCHAGVTDCHGVGDNLSLVPNNDPKSNPNNIVECEFEVIQNLYNSVIDNNKPNWSKLTIINDKRKGKIKKLITFAKQRIKQSSDANETSVEYIGRLLSALATDEFYSGHSRRGQYPNGYKWDFEGITSETHIIKFIEREAT
jgi:AraC-like DNA-binding protein